MEYKQNRVGKAKLLEIGIEAFGILEEEEKRQKEGKKRQEGEMKKRQEEEKKKRQPAIAPPPKAKIKTPAWPVIPIATACNYQYQPQQTLVYQVKDPVSATEEMIQSHEAMKLSDGLLVMDYSKRKSVDICDLY